MYATFFYNEKGDIVIVDNVGVTLDSNSVYSYGEGSVTATTTDELDWRLIYKNTTPISVGGKIVQASIAKTYPERIQGLSGTPYLPEEVVKLFIFDTAGLHSIWMKDMNYSIDIMWLNEDKEIIYIVENASPDSYPESFTPDEDALYVVEAVVGFVQKNDINLGDVMLMSGDEIST